MRISNSNKLFQLAAIIFLSISLLAGCQTAKEDPSRPADYNEYTAMDKALEEIRPRVDAGEFGNPNDRKSFSHPKYYQAVGRLITKYVRLGYKAP